VGECGIVTLRCNVVTTDYVISTQRSQLYKFTWPQRSFSTLAYFATLQATLSRRVFCVIAITWRPRGFSTLLCHVVESTWLLPHKKT